MRYQILDITTITINRCNGVELQHIMHITKVHNEQFEDIKSIACDKITANRIKAVLKQGIDCYLNGEFLLESIPKAMQKDYPYLFLLGIPPRYIQDSEERALYEIKKTTQHYSRVFCIYNGPDEATERTFVKGWSPAERQAYLFSIT